MREAISRGCGRIHHGQGEWPSAKRAIGGVLCVARDCHCWQFSWVTGLGGVCQRSPEAAPRGHAQGGSQQWSLERSADLASKFDPAYPWGTMAEARDFFLSQLQPDAADTAIGELRRSLTQAKKEALDQVEGLDEAGLKLVMPGLYQQIVATTVQIAAHVGLVVGLALEAHDELTSEASISSFSRPVRDQMTETGVAMKRRHGSRIAKVVAEVEAQRLAWRHNHEFLSWLGFRRDDERYPPADRRARLEAFKVQSRLLQSREAVAERIGWPLAAALEAHDRFMLANRWRLAPGEEHAVERYVWPLLSYQGKEVVLLESARHDYDALVGAEAPEEELARAREELGALFDDQLAYALKHAPEGMLTSHVM
jgi:hypothetical protein